MLTNLIVLPVQAELHNSLILGGGITGKHFTRKLEVIGNYKYKLPDFPQSYVGHSMVTNNSNDLMVLGGGFFPKNDASLDCLIYRNNRWSLVSS